MKFRLLSLTLVLLASASAFAWNCSDPLASRVDVGTTKPSGTPGKGDGQYFLGTGSEGTKGHYYICEVPKPPHTCQGGHNCNKGGGSSSSSSSTSSSNQTQGQQQGQTQTANGGNATATGGAGGNATSTSGVKNSGNSSNTNNNQSSAAASDNGNGNGNNSNNYASTTNYKAADIPVSTAFAPTTIPTANCFKGYGAGVQTMPVGVSLGGGKIDENCRALQTALHAPNRLTYCKLFINLQDSKKAHITMDDCMGFDPEPKAELAPPPAPAQPQIVVVPMQPAPAQTVVPAVVPSQPLPVVEEVIPLGICTFASKTQCTPAGSDAFIVDPSRPTSVCKQMLAAARQALAAHPGYVIVLRGNRNSSEDQLIAVTRANNVKRQLVADGVKSSQVKTEAGLGTSRTVQITLEPVVQ